MEQSQKSRRQVNTGGPAGGFGGVGGVQKPVGSVQKPVGGNRQPAGGAQRTVGKPQSAQNVPNSGVAQPAKLTVFPKVIKWCFLWPVLIFTLPGFLLGRINRSTKLNWNTKRMLVRLIDTGFGMLFFVIYVTIIVGVVMLVIKLA